MFPRYTAFVLKNVTITLPEDAARRARIETAKVNTSVSKLVGRMVEERMLRQQASDKTNPEEVRDAKEYAAAYERSMQLTETFDVDAANRLTREEAHDRRR